MIKFRVQVTDSEGVDRRVAEGGGLTKIFVGFERTFGSLCDLRHGVSDMVHDNLHFRFREKFVREVMGQCLPADSS